VAWWFGRRSLLAEIDQRLKTTAEKVNELNAATNEKLRAAHNKAKTDLEQLNASVASKVAAAVASEKAATSRLLSQLDMAYAELDRLRRQGSPRAAAKRDLVHGFAETEAMETQR
jgi:hypothetical protein